MKEYVSHYRQTDGVYQTSDTHQNHVADLSKEYCRIRSLKTTAYLTGFHHDDGKLIEDWVSYFKANLQKEQNFSGEKMDHSTLGGLVLESYAPDTFFSQMAETAIFTHHGLADCVSVKDGKALIQERKKKYTAEQIAAVRRTCEQELGLSEEKMKVLCGQAGRELKPLLEQIKRLPYDENRQRVYGNASFYLGMCERLLFSALADADVRDTVDFLENRKTSTGMSEEELHQVWKSGLENLERNLENMKTGKNAGSPLNPIREEISVRCEQAGYSGANLYRLAVPTGAGKTLSALRFALRRAYETKKRHIFYVAPFKSILDQNAEEIRRAVGNRDWVLEHHGDVVFEEEEENWRYERLIENWDEVPVIVTTAVQFFQTLYREKKRNLRRFHSLCDSVIILDEVQALPVKVMGLFNLAVNFLTELAGSTVVLCTATQPPFEKVAKNRMKRAVDMAGRLSLYEPKFRRVEYYDCTDGGRKSIGIEEAADFIREKAEEEKQVLAIFNTKRAAARVFESLKGKTEGKLFHLSDSMCAENRSDMLAEIRKALKRGEEVVCISTQLVEAGVDFSFGCVIRSLAGLDNLIQAAGRCNRNGLLSMGHVYVILMNGDAENLSSLADIRKRQEGMRKLLRIYQNSPERFEGRLDSEKAIQDYYKEYLRDRNEEEKYPAILDGIPVNLIDLLSDNRKFAGQVQNVLLRQAFKTAGELFSLIDEKGGTDVVVPYKDAGIILQELPETADQEKRKSLMRKLQRYTVNLTDSTIRKIGQGAIHKREDGILVLKERYYDPQMGVCTEPREMEYLEF